MTSSRRSPRRVIGPSALLLALVAACAPGSDPPPTDDGPLSLDGLSAWALGGRPPVEAGRPPVEGERPPTGGEHPPAESVRAAVERIARERPDNALAARRLLLAHACETRDRPGALRALRDLGTFHTEALSPEIYADAAHRIAARTPRRGLDAKALQHALDVLHQGVDDFPDSEPLRDLRLQFAQRLRAAEATPYEYWLLAEPTDADGR